MTMFIKSTPVRRDEGSSHGEVDSVMIEYKDQETEEKFGTCNDNTVLPDGVVELSQAEWNTAVTGLFESYRQIAIRTTYQSAYDQREAIVSYYHPSEISEGHTKFVEAGDAIAAANAAAAKTAAPRIAVEAKRRGITTKALAALVVDRYEEFFGAARLISGRRGAITDALDAFGPDLAGSLAFEASLKEMFDYFYDNIESGWD